MSEQKQQPEGKPYSGGPRRAPKFPYDIQVQNIEMEVPPGANIAQGWEPWSATDDGFEKPELGALELNGRRVQGVIAEHRYDVAFRQQAQVEPGLGVTFRMQFRVDPGQHSDRPRPQAMVVGVGIDPHGNSDPRGDTVQWALRDLAYSRVVTASVTATAQSEVITLFVRSIAFLPGSGTASGLGSTRVCYPDVCARDRYDRTYILLPPGASANMWGQAANAAALNRWTLGGSADDAGLASILLGKQNTRVIAVDPAGWPDGGLTGGWYDMNYSPGVTFVTAESWRLADPHAFVQFVDNA